MNNNLAIIIIIIIIIILYRKCNKKSIKKVKKKKKEKFTEAIYTEDGKKCFFPFTYKGETHDTCITNGNDDNGKSWCATKKDWKSGDKEWGWCELELEEIYTKDGKKCFFPFTYKGKTHHTCTTNGNDGNGKSWCATKRNWKSGDKEWGWCEEDTIEEVEDNYDLEDIDDHDRIETNKGFYCKFPFKYEGKWYDNCTNDDTKYNNGWCAIAVKKDGTFNKDDWGYCL